MIYPCKRIKLHTLVVDGVYGGSLGDLRVQEFGDRCLLGWFVH